VLGIASGVSKTLAIFDCGLSDVAADPTFRLTAAFKVCKKYFLFKKIEQERKLYIKAENICSEKYVTILLSLSAPLTDCCFSDATTAVRIDRKQYVIANSSRLSHGESKIPFPC